MAIPNSRLEKWAERGEVAPAKASGEEIYNVLERGVSSSDFAYNVYLQGSYGNYTNIVGDSDVDVMVELTSRFRYSLSLLSPADAEAVRRTIVSAPNNWDQFRADVIKALESWFGKDDVNPARKCINVAGGPGRLPADVVVAQEYRRYSGDSLTGTLRHDNGIAFKELPGRCEIINYPKQHQANGETKMAEDHTDRRFKRTVRVFKNMRNCMIDRGYIEADLAPSYFLQCLIYNAPDPLFRPDLQETVYGILNWACELQDYEWATLKCQNEIDLLFGLTPEQWDIPRAQLFAWRARQLWNDWR